MGLDVHVGLLNGRAGEGHALDSAVAIRELGLNRRNPMPAVLRLRAAMREVDVTYSFLDLGNALAALARPASARLVWGLRMAGVERGLRARIAFSLARMLATRVDYCISNSEAALAEYRRRGFRLPQSTVIDNGIDPRIFRPDENRRAAGRSIVGAGAGEVVIGSIARANSIKRHDLILGAALQLLTTRAKVKVALVGRGTEALLERSGIPATHRSRFIALGERSETDVLAVLAALDISVSASDIEGFPNNLLESMACGVPCVATRAGATAHLVADTGLLVDPGDGSGLMRALATLVDDPPLRRQLGRSARERVMERFTRQRMVLQTRSRLEALVS